MRDGFRGEEGVAPSGGREAQVAALEELKKRSLPAQGGADDIPVGWRVGGGGEAEVQVFEQGWVGVVVVVVRDSTVRVGVMPVEGAVGDVDHRRAD